MRCCAGATSADPPACLNSLSCAGSKCTCIAEVQGGNYSALSFLVRRVDGTVWKTLNYNAAFSQQLYIDNSPLIASAVALTHNVGCAVVTGGAVWCFPISGTITDSTLLGAALDNTVSTSAPVQVVTSSTGGALTDVRQINATRGANQLTFCAVTGDGSVWCWGQGTRGELGHGDTSNASYARKVMADASTPFTGAVQVTVGQEATCALKTDGSIWCWGTNGFGELGAATPAKSFYPLQIQLIGTTVQRTAKRLSSNSFQTFCAIMMDTSVECWGYNGYGAAGQPTGNTVTPSVVLVASGGAALLNVVDLININGWTGAKTAALDLLFWGNNNNTSNVYPQPALDNSNTAITLIRTPLEGGSPYAPYWAFVDAAGRLSNGTPFSSVAQPPCTNLLSN